MATCPFGYRRRHQDSVIAIEFCDATDSIQNEKRKKLRSKFLLDICWVKSKSSLDAYKLSLLQNLSCPPITWVPQACPNSLSAITSGWISMRAFTGSELRA